ncbi:MAG: (Fe-S)-binding protein [Candidatus Helarchaeota archaeon]
MGLLSTFKKFSWILPILFKSDRETLMGVIKNFMNKKKNFYPKEKRKADVKGLINCMLCPNMCRFDCGSLQAAKTESMSPSYKSRIGYYLTIGKIDLKDPNNRDFIDLMYKCTNEESCKIWCPFDFSVVSLLETVREDLFEEGLTPDSLKIIINNLKTTKTVENYNIFKKYKELGIENIETNGTDQIFYYIGCESMKLPAVVNSNIKILKNAGIKFSTNLENKICCGAPAFNIRDLKSFKELAKENQELITNTGADIIISDCPGCVLTLKERYKKIGVKIKTKIYHTTFYINQLISEGKVKLKNELNDQFKRITIHDPCLLSRNLNDTTSIRSILNKIPGLKIIEPIFRLDKTHCCGWSGTLHWVDRNISIKQSSNRINELIETGAHIIASACPLCELGLSYGIEENNKNIIKVIDISEIISYLI